MKKAAIFDMYEALITLWHMKPYMGRTLSEDGGIEESRFREIRDATEDERTLGIMSFEEVIERIFQTYVIKKVFPRAQQICSLERPYLI